jgi:hypothetical protein
MAKQVINSTSGTTETLASAGPKLNSNFDELYAYDEANTTAVNALDSRLDTAESDVSQLESDVAQLQSGEISLVRIGVLVKWGTIDAGIASVARSSNVATIVTNKPHRILVGQKVRINAADDTFDALGSSFATVLAVPNNTSFTYANVGSDLGTTASSGTLATWELVSDASHAPTRDTSITSISASGIVITWASLPTPPSGFTWKVSGSGFANHQNNASATYEPHYVGLGVNNATIALRHTRMLHGRAYWNGTTTGGGVTANANWVKEGDCTSIGWSGDPNNALFVGHTENLPTSGSRGASSFPLPILQPVGGSIWPALPNYQVSPFTADAFRPSLTGFYTRLYSPSGTLLDQAALEAISPASNVQIAFSRVGDTVVQDHTLPPFAVTFFAEIMLVLAPI